MEYYLTPLWIVIISCSMHTAPVATQYAVHFTMPDNNNPPFNPIGNIVANLPQFVQQGPFQIITKKYSYQKFNQYFRIADSGDVTLVRALDRDDVNNVCGPLQCCDRSTCTITLDLAVTARRTAQRFSVTVTISISDENDHAPKFTDDSFSVSILEEEKLHVPYRLPSAFDSDSPLFQIKSYTLSGSWSDRFLLKVEHMEPFLVPKGSFDYEDESQRKFELFLTAQDNGGKTGILSIHVNILDINDNGPICDIPAANVSVLENTTYSDPIYKFKATDKDSGVNGRITYTLSSTTMPLIKGIFHLNNETGDLVLLKRLDFELYSEQNFRVSVRASDNGIPQRSDLCSLDVHVQDLNDNSPVIDIDTMRDIPENTVVKEPVVKFYVRDDDTTENEVLCRTERYSPGLRLALIEKQSYAVYVDGTYDREQTRNLTMTLLCHDSGAVPQKTEILLTIPVKDKNDNNPRFPKSVYEVSIPEDFPLRKPFISVTAFDEDDDAFGTVKYSLDGASVLYFSVDQDKGDVALLLPLDRENKDFFVVSVTATDGGGLSNRSRIEVRVTDVNDNAPGLIAGLRMDVRENVPRGTVVGHFVVQDGDLGDSGRTWWTCELIDNATTLLHVDNVTILTAGDIDRESVDQLFVVVTMGDRGSPPLSSTATITVSIVDDNDNIPQVTYPPPGTVIDDGVTTVPTNAPRLSHVVSITCHDPDTGVNGQVLYRVLPHTNGSKFFKINETGGQLLTNWAYDSTSFTPTHPKEGLYKVAFSAYNPVRSTVEAESSSSTSSYFYVRVTPYRHFINNELFQQQHQRPFFNNVVLLILIGGFTVSLSAALISSIIWAKSKYSSESHNLEQVHNSDGKFMMMMMSAEQHQQQKSNHSYVYDPYCSLLMDHERTIDNGYPVVQSRSSTTSSLRRTGREPALWNHYDSKTMPRNLIQPDVARYCASETYNNSYSLSTTDLASAASTTGRQPKLTNSFYRHFEHETECHSPIIPTTTRAQTIENQYGSISPMRASICDPTPNIATTSNWVPRVSGAEATNSHTMC